MLRRLLRMLVGRAVREVVRQGRRAARARAERPAGRRPTIIDLERVDDGRSFDRFFEPSRRTVARAVAVQGGAGVSSEALLLALIESHPPSAEQLARGGADLDALARHLRGTLGAASERRPTSDARRTLRQAPTLADGRGAREVEPRDLLQALLAPDGRLAPVVDRYTSGTLPPRPSG